MRTVNDILNSAKAGGRIYPRTADTILAAHVKAYTKTTKTGKSVTVMEHDDGRVSAHPSDLSAHLWNKMKPADRHKAIGEAHLDAEEHIHSDHAENKYAKDLAHGHRSELKSVPLKSLKPTQAGEDRINSSSEETAKMIKENSVYYHHDLHPIIVHGPTGKIMNGNHRYTAAVANGQKNIHAIVYHPK